MSAMRLKEGGSMELPNSLARAINDHAQFIDDLRELVSDLHQRVSRLERELKERAPVDPLPAPEPEWRPMSTAPRDGRWVLLLVKEDQRRHDGRAVEIMRAEAGSWVDGMEMQWRLHSHHGLGWLPIPGEGPR